MEFRKAFAVLPVGQEFVYYRGHLNEGRLFKVGRSNLALKMVVREARKHLFHLATFLMRADNLRRSSPMGELDRTGVIITLWLHAVERGLRNPETRERFSDLAKHLGYESLASINATSIGAATGMPRETVRRKLKELEKDRLVVDLGKGQYRLGSLDAETCTGLSKVFEQFMHESMRFINTCIAEETLYVEGVLSGTPILEDSQKIPRILH